MLIKNHPTLGKKVSKLFLFTWLTLVILIILCVYGKNIIPNFEAKHYFLVLFTLFWIIAIYFFAWVFYSLNFVNCPECDHKTITKSCTKELPDHYSAYCKKCDIIWDLGIGNGD
jgi:hypothetical protein